MDHQGSLGRIHRHLAQGPREARMLRRRPPLHFPLTYQRQHNGTDIQGATNASMKVLNASGDVAGAYCVHVWNQSASTNVCALLTVAPKPRLVITEMMGGHSTNTSVSSHGDWWELTNFDTNAVNLTGYRFDDYPGLLDGAVVITNAVVMQPMDIYVTNQVVIQPGESILFLSDMTPEAFACWWGEENLPERAQFVCYAGNGFQAVGDSVTLCNATATDPNDFLARAEYVNLNPDLSTHCLAAPWLPRSAGRRSAGHRSRLRRSRSNGPDIRH